MHGICFQQQDEKDFTASVREVLLKIGAFDEDSAVLETIMTIEDLLRSKLLEQVMGNRNNKNMQC
jgi:hypothetical protein